MHASKDSMWRGILKNFAKFWKLNRHHRHLYNVSQTEVNAAAYQEDECYDEEGPRQPVSNIIYDKPLNREDEPGPIFEAAEIARLMKASSKEVNVVIGDEDEEDDTLMEVDSDDE